MAFDVLDSVFSIWHSLCTHVKGHPQLIAGTFLGDGPVIFGALLYKIARPRSQLVSFCRITSHLDIFAGILHFLRKKSSGLLSSWTRGRHSCWLPASWEQQAGWDPTPQLMVTQVSTGLGFSWGLCSTDQLPSCLMRYPHLYCSGLFAGRRPKFTFCLFPFSAPKNLLESLTFWCLHILLSIFILEGFWVKGIK